MREFLSRYPVLTFVLLTLVYQFAVVGIVWWLLPAGSAMHKDEVAHMVFRLRVFGPLLFAVLITAYLEGQAGLRDLFGGFLHWRVPARWYVLAIGWKFFFTWAGVALLAVLGMRHWPGFFVLELSEGDLGAIRGLTSNLPFIVGIAFVEETAWMKFSVTRLQERFHALPACLLVGCAWALWYLPMLLVGEGVPDGYPWPMFMLSMIALTILLGWTYNMTRSGTILLIMQIVSNCAFFILPVLPGLWGMDSIYVVAFVWVNVCCAMMIVVFYGWRELGTRQRARWSEEMPASPAADPPIQNNSA